MKKKLKILGIPAFIALITIAIYLYSTICHRVLPEIENYSITSNIGKTIPARLYSRIKIVTIDDRQQKVHELLLRFDDVLVADKNNDVKNEAELYQNLIIVPSFKMIGLMNDGNSFIVNSKELCQCSEIADTFTPLVNNTTLYSNPPIKTAKFSDNEISFNTFGVLKKFGSTVIIKIK